ncbi:MAG: ACP S-malonyltransferase [Simkaniaceae bacterium]
MSKKVVFLFPGQGAQYVGMGQDLYEAFSEAKKIFNRADELLGYSLTSIMFEGPEDKLKETSVCQLAIFVHSAALLSLIPNSITPVAVAGLSLGEYSALYASRILSFDEGLKLVEKRGRFMQKAAAENPGTMAAVIGLDPEKTAKNLPEGASIANLNCPGQVVIGGSLEAVEKAQTLLKEAGARRVIPLSVSGAFHTPLMKGAALALKPFIDKACFNKPRCRIVFNASGSFSENLTEIKELLYKQVMEPVYFEKSLRELLALKINDFLEIGPGQTLAGMMKKIDREKSVLSIGTSSDLSKLSIYQEAT